MKIAYISHHGRPNYEFGWFSRIPADRIKFIDTDFSGYPSNPPSNIEYCQVDFSENFFLKGKFHSTASLVRYDSFEMYLRDVEVVIVLELFSSLSRQFVEYCKKHGKKSVVIVYELIPTHPLYYLPTHYGNRKYVAKNASLFVCVSKVAKRSLLQLGVDPKKIEVVYPGIDLRVFKPFSIRKKGANIIFIGGLEYHKGIDVFLDVADRILPRFPDIKMAVVGDGSYREDVMKRTHIHKNFKYLGKIDNRHLPQVMRDYGIYLMPCREVSRFGLKIVAEQFGFSFVEAMACGLAVVTTKCGAIPEIVTDKNFICNQDDVFQMEIEVKKLIESVERRTKLSHDNINLTRNSYDIERQGRRLFELMRKKCF